MYSHHDRILRPALRNPFDAVLVGCEPGLGLGQGLFRLARIEHDIYFGPDSQVSTMAQHPGSPLKMSFTEPRASKPVSEHVVEPALQMPMARLFWRLRHILGPATKSRLPSLILGDFPETHPDHLADCWWKGLFTPVIPFDMPSAASRAVCSSPEDPTQRAVTFFSPATQ